MTDASRSCLSARHKHDLAFRRHAIRVIVFPNELVSPAASSAGRKFGNTIAAYSSVRGVLAPAVVMRMRFARAARFTNEARDSRASRRTDQKFEYRSTRGENGSAAYRAGAWRS